MDTVAVLGGGSFGTALAQLVANAGHNVRLWLRDPKAAHTINTTHHNPGYLSEFDLNRRVVATTDLAHATHNVAWVLVTVPSHALRSVMTDAKPHLPQVPIIIGVKGIETNSLMTMEEVVRDVLGTSNRSPLLALSGPSFAREIMQGQPTAVVLACADETLAQSISESLFSDAFRAYTSNDVVGVEMGGALKNVIAIAAGVVSGLGFGDNARAALMTRGLAEISRLAEAKGGNPLTLMGLAGMGDLLLTCTGKLSRNRAVGQALGEGKSLEQALASVKQTAEGVFTARSAHALAQKLGVEARITQAVYAALYEGASVADGVMALVSRPPGSELA